MNIALRAIQISLVFVCLVLAAPPAVRAQDAGAKPFTPYTGQPGRDVIWVPTPDVTVQKMLDIARLTPEDSAASCWTI